MALASKERRVFDRNYEILSVTGRGSKSVVYRAIFRPEGTDVPPSEVALKVLLTGNDMTADRVRLRNEALAMVTSQHPFVIRLNDFQSVQDLCYLSMEFAAGGDLAKYTKARGGKLPPKQAELFFRQCAEALDFIHAVGITHRDIKPDNVLVADDREIRIGDFGVATVPGDRSTSNDLKLAVGTLDYMAPEVLEGTACDARSDLYSLALTFYELVAGRHPFEGVPMARQLDVRREAAVASLDAAVAGVSPAFARVITACLRYDPAERPGSGGALLEAMGAAPPDETETAETAETRGPRAAVVTAVPARDPAGAPGGGATEEPSGEPERTMTGIGDDEDDGGTSYARPSRQGPEGGRYRMEPSPAGRDDAGRRPPVRPDRNMTEYIPSEVVTRFRTPAPDAPEDAEADEPFAARGPRGGARAARRDAAEEFGPSPRRRGRRAPPPVDEPEDDTGGGYDAASDPDEPEYRRRRPAPIVVLGLLLLVAGGIYAFKDSLGLPDIGKSLGPVAALFGGSGGERAPEGTPDTGTAAPAAPDSPADDVESPAGESAFPALARGTHVGTVEGLVPGEPSALVLVSDPDRRRLTVITGTHGSSPSVAEYREGDSFVSVPANGSILRFAGTTSGDVTKGEVIDRATGDGGTWTVTLRRGARQTAPPETEAGE